MESPFYSKVAGLSPFLPNNPIFLFAKSLPIETFANLQVEPKKQQTINGQFFQLFQYII